MTVSQTKQIINLLKYKGILFEEGLSDKEVIQIQNEFEVIFPPDLKRLLQKELPTGERFIDWRKGLIDAQVAVNIRRMLNWTWEGMLIEVVERGFWIDSWGNQPDDKKDRVQIAKHHYDSYPKLVPVYGHRFIPSEPSIEGNPILSVWGMDIIYYGYDLPTYFANEFHFKLNDSFKIISEPNRSIEFWSWWIEKE